MPEESIINLLRPDFPKTTESRGSFSTELEYVGEKSVLEAARPSRDSIWGLYDGLVSSTTLEPIELTDRAILLVTVETASDTSEYTFETGQRKEVSYEIDWVDVQKPMIQHPKFAVGGGGEHELTSGDLAAIEAWKNGADTEHKEIYEYPIDSASGSPTWATLSANAIMFARGIELGIEYFNYKAPVARQTETWVKGPPTRAEAGLKDDPPAGFPNLPTGYEWIRESDRSLRRGGVRKWDRDIEWIGALKVYVDAEEIFWEAPTL